MPQAQIAPTIHHARAGRITDQTLDEVTQAATRAQDGITLTEAEAQLILLTAPQICEELRQRRARMDLISDVADDTNQLLMFPGARENV